MHQIKRNIENRLLSSLNKKEITILIGARQIGKSTLLKKITNDLQRGGERVLFLNMDIEADAAFLQSQQNLLNRIQLEFGSDKGYVVIDEIQQKVDAGRFLKGLYDMDLPYKFVVTGSGSLELKERIAESLSGRKHLIEMYPVTFKEFIDYKTKYKYSNRLEMFCQIESEKTYLLLKEYLSFGGYPKVITSSEIQIKVETINEIFTAYVTRDITFLLDVRSPNKFIKMIKLLAIQSGGKMNFSQLASDVGMNVDTIKNYLYYAVQTFIIDEVVPHFSNPKKEITKSPTIYFNDTGMCNFAKGNFGSIINETDGFIFQSFVYQLLRDKYKTPINPVKYWRTKDKAEVDFIVEDKGEVIPVEVKFSNLTKTTISRSLKSFITKYEPEKVYVVNLSMDETIKVNNSTVHFIPFWRLIFY